MDKRSGDKQQTPPAFGLSAAALLSVSGQVGCVTIIIVGGALLLGLWLDSQFHTRPWLTLGLLLVSVPISTFAMLRVVQGTTRQLQKMQANRDKENREA